MKTRKQKETNEKETCDCIVDNYVAIDCIC